LSGSVILCVDDDNDVLALLVSALTTCGHQVLVAADGRKALEIAASNRLDAVILDYVLPEMNGGQIAAGIKRLRPLTPVIMFSGSSDIPASDLIHVNSSVHKLQGLRKLLAVLQRSLPTHGCRRADLRKFARFTVNVPFAAVVTRSGSTATLSGVSVDLAEGGIGGMIEGELEVGETVHIRITGPELGLTLAQPAQVRHRHGAVYGFEFLEMTPPQQAELRRTCLERAPGLAS